MSFDVDASLIPFFHPQGVVVVGASRNPTKLGYGLARNLVQSGYQGAIYFVNPKGGVLLDKPVYVDVASLPDPVDLGVILIPARFIPRAIEACGRRGIRAVILAAGGFRETGPEGAALEDECLRIAREFDMRLVGPNCIGILDTHVPIDSTFLPPPGPTPGDVAFISHSGAICAAVIDWARGQGFGLSRLVSLGNQVDVCETDVLAPVAADPFTRVLTLYLEGVRAGRRFVHEAQQVAREKPIIALKVGRFESGQKAVASHTGALAGLEAAFNAAFRRAGVIRADTNEEMFDWARALAWCPLPKGNRVAVLTNAGGPGVTAADALERKDLKLSELTPDTRRALQEVLPPAASVNNPVDMLATASPEQYTRCLRILLAAPEVDSVVVILPPLPMYTAGSVAQAMIPLIYTTDKPVLVALMGERMIQEAVEHFRAAHVPEYRFPERAVSALAVLTRRAEFLAQEPEPPAQLEDVYPELVYNTLNWLSRSNVKSPPGHPEETSQDVPLSAEDGFISQEVVTRILNAYGITIPDARLARTARQAVDAAKQMGMPVVLKVASLDIPHKSDIGGVALNLEDAQAVEDGFRKILENSRAALPEAEILGVHVQPMIPHGQEVIIGTIQDPQFGALVMFGSGGVEVEGLKDVAFALAPLSRPEAEYLLENTWAGRKLRGYRNLPPADREAVINVILRLGQLAADFPQLAEIEINPLRVLPEGRGAVAVDIRAKVKR